MASTRPSGWIKGIVKETPSGDTLVIASAPRPGAPEKRITLSSLISPKLVRQRQLTVIIPCLPAAMASNQQRWRV